MKFKHLPMKAANRYIIAVICISLFTGKIFSQNVSPTLEKKYTESSSIFEFALSNKELLQLDNSQKNKLASLLTTLKSVQINPYFDKEQYERAGVANTLTDEQFTKLMELKNEKLIAIKTHNAWSNLAATGYAKAIDAQEAMKEISVYYAKLMAIQSLQGNILSLKNSLYVKDSLYQVPVSYYSQSRIDSVAKIITTHSKTMPEALAMLYEIKKGSSPRIVQKAKLISKGNQEGTIGYTLNISDSLGLSDIQIDSLIIAAMGLSDSAFKKDWSKALAYESEHLSKILTDAQYQKMEFKKWDTQNVARVEQTWNELVQRKLIDNSINVQKEKADIKHYYQVKQYIIDRYAYNLLDRTRQLNTLDKNKPYLLTMLTEAQHSSKGNANSGYAW